MSDAPKTNTVPHRKAVRVLIHDYEKARKATKAGNMTVLQFQDLTQHILLPTGQHIRKDPKGPSKRERRLMKRSAAKLSC